MLRSCYIRFNISLFGPLIMRLIKLKHLLCILNSLSIKHIRLLSNMNLSFGSTSRFQNNLTGWNCLNDFWFNVISYWGFFDCNNFIFKLVGSCCHTILIILFIIFICFYKLNVLFIIYNFCLIKLCQHGTAWLSISIIKLWRVYLK